MATGFVVPLVAFLYIFYFTISSRKKINVNELYTDNIDLAEELNRANLFNLCYLYVALIVAFGIICPVLEP